MQEVHVLIVAVVLRALPLVELIVRGEELEALHLVEVGVCQVVLAPGRAAVGDDERGCVGETAERAQLHHVAEERADGQRMLEPGVAVLHECEVHREVGSALGGGGEAELTGGHDYPLPHLSVARHVLLDGLGVVVVRVPAQHVARVLEALDVVGREHPRAGGIEPGSDQLANLHQIAVGDDVLGRGLRIALRGDAVSELRQEL